MYMTVEQALSVYPLTEAKLIAGEAGKRRIVKSVNVMDAPDITDWIKEGEMLFTTAYLIKDHPEDAEKLIYKLNQCGSSGLGIKLGRFWTQVPENLIVKANELGFPLIELPYQFTFSDQMGGLFRDEMKRNTGALQDIMGKQVRLMRYALQSEPIGSLFESVAEVIGYPIAVIGSRGQMMFNSSGIPDEQLLAKRPWPIQQQWMKAPEWQAYRIPLMRQQECTGFALFFSAQPFLSSMEEGLYSQAAELIAHHTNLKLEDYFAISVQKDFAQLLKRYLKHGLPLAALQTYAERWEIDLLNQPYRCVVTDLRAALDGKKRLELLESLKTACLSHARMQELQGVHVVLDDGLVSLVPDPDGQAEEKVKTALISCFDGWKRGYEPQSIISSRKRRADHLFESFDECCRARQLASDWELGDSIISYDSLDLALVFEQVSETRMKTFCDRWLGSLLEKEPEYAQEMLRTLETYLECDGQLGETAKRLFIHRNTATYRIEKLSELLNVDFKKMNDLMRLKLAFVFRKRLER
ncbi:purine catabolism regulator [Paenibacillus phyllosphaerae]|uniref:Purine catabolism regulator n=1 Tax=Paenibacillus phyllosphaerae TaxID=274593 RepID=A0A7W5AUN3_9BACL|nr:PucR family transcriptional regulator ligand-binding domain-containing protein [Paenibacillus phyllosphaerae]MBB3108486.1 purine catabolism regulator [Paenibacillus phyllosphaerae]